MIITPVVHILNKAQALAEASLIFSSGCDGLWLINHHGDDHLTLSLAKTLKEAHPNRLIGVNLLSMDAETALKSCLALNIKNLWLDRAGIHSTYKDDELIRKLSQAHLDEGINIFAGTAFKYQRPDNNPAAAAQIASSNNLIATTSGVGTGHAADLDKIKTMSVAVNGELAVASGLTVENIATYAPYVKYALVATGVSRDEHHLEPEKLNAFVEQVRSL